MSRLAGRIKVTFNNTSLQKEFDLKFPSRASQSTAEPFPNPCPSLRPLWSILAPSFPEKTLLFCLPEKAKLTTERSKEVKLTPLVSFWISYADFKAGSVPSPQPCPPPACLYFYEGQSGKPESHSPQSFGPCCARCRGREHHWHLIAWTLESSLIKGAQSAFSYRPSWGAWSPHGLPTLLLPPGLSPFAPFLLAFCFKAFLPPACTTQSPAPGSDHSTPTLLGCTWVAGARFPPRRTPPQARAPRRAAHPRLIPRWQQDAGADAAPGSPSGCFPEQIAGDTAAELRGVSPQCGSSGGASGQHSWRGPGVGRCSRGHSIDSLFPTIGGKLECRLQGSVILGEHPSLWTATQVTG